MNKDGEIFWLDGWVGRVRSGVFVRCNLNKVIKDFNEKFNVKVVGIKLDIESDGNLEFIIAEKEGQP